MNIYFFLFFLIVCGLFIIYGRKLYVITSIDDLPHLISKGMLGKLEGRIENLRQVVIIADFLELPSGTLFEAVKINFEKEVKYLFFISKSKFDQQLHTLKLFNELAKSIHPSKDLVFMYPLTFDWNGNSHIFYRYFDEKIKELKLFACIGNQNEGGIADYYELLTPVTAMNIIELVFKGNQIPQIDNIGEKELENATPIIKLKPAS